MGIVAITDMIMMSIVQISSALTSACWVVGSVWWGFWWVLGHREAHWRINGCRPIGCDGYLTPPFLRSIKPMNMHHHTTIKLMMTLKGKRVIGMEMMLRLGSLKGDGIREDRQKIRYKKYSRQDFPLKVLLRQR